MNSKTNGHVLQHFCILPNLSAFLQNGAMVSFAKGAERATVQHLVQNKQVTVQHSLNTVEENQPRLYAKSLERALNQQPFDSH